MTLQEAVNDYQYDVSIYYFPATDDEQEGWAWDINGGYCSTGGRHRYTDIKQAVNELLIFLKTFEPFEK